MTERRDPVIFTTIVVAQFCGTSLWFATNAVLPQFQLLYGWSPASLGYLTATIQLGFIVGTLLFAIKGIADKHSPSKVFLVCSIIGGLTNATTLLKPESLEVALLGRFLTGFFLAGIYPVGMKIAADYRQQGLGNWLGALVGALVLGTAFPHVLRLLPMFEDFVWLITGVSVVAILGGVILFILVPDGPFRSSGMKFNVAGIRDGFRSKDFRAAAFGYFGHMWELYAFWAFVPYLVIRKFMFEQNAQAIQILPFIIIAIGAVGCVAGGLWSRKVGSYKVAFYALVISGACCILSPWIFAVPSWLYVIFMLVWGFSVVADSPQFSALVAAHAPTHVKGSAITIVTSIGFAITIISIQLLTYLGNNAGNYIMWILVPGPLVGILLMRRNK